MAVKRKRAATAGEGLASGQNLKRAKVDDYSLWGWVGTEVADASNITPEHRLFAYGLTSNQFPRCQNKYTAQGSQDAAMDDGAIVVTDDDCDKKTCKQNPWCLNYLGQEKWENREIAEKTYRKACKSEDDPSFDTREGHLPVGLENLGATCYANAFLQVWFRHVAFRNAVYQCQPLAASSQTFLESPVYQLQVTFAALQHLKKKAYNPLKLVESLKLRASEQQDAQEFSKLFLSHLDGEFKKQDNPALKALISSQFEGKQAYVTICHGCQRRSERETEFLELEVNLEPDASLEDQLRSLIADEILSGDNKYLCSNCNTLQDATRRVELNELPPILHISLLRFVFDLVSLERKKSKHTLSFPETIDMGQFVSGPANAGRQYIYQLRGVLLHKGASAYHGHYEAEVFDEPAVKWYSFNDQLVDELKPSKLAVKKTKEQSAAARSKKAAPVTITNGATSNGCTVDASRRSSKDAYMLVYARVSDSAIPPAEAHSAPAHAMEEIQRLNAAHEEAMTQHQAKEADAMSNFHSRRNQITAIYRSWTSVPDERPRIVSRQSLEMWLIRAFGGKAPPTKEQPEVEEVPPAADPDVQEVPPPTDDANPHHLALSDIICPHGKLDPRKAANIKCIGEAAAERIQVDTGFEFEPSSLTVDDVCEACVLTEFEDRSYKQQHPIDVSRLDELINTDPFKEDAGFWLSKAWLKDWRMAKPKMHTAGQQDPAPDSGEFRQDVICDHDALSALAGRRRLISTEARDFLLSLFPDWLAIDGHAELCNVCEVDASTTNEGRRNMRRQAEIEKAELKPMFDNTLSGTALLDIENHCAVIPGQFIRSWRQWILRPTDSDRPTEVDTRQFMCEHDHLNFDPSEEADWTDSHGAVRQSEWEVLARHYTVGPHIGIATVTATESGAKVFVPAIPVCSECRRQLKTGWESTQVTVRVMNSTKTSPQKDLKQLTLHTYGKRGARQSKRLRDVRTHGARTERHKVAIWPSMDVKALKLEIEKGLDVSPIAQRLHFRGQQLDDNATTMASLGVEVNDVFELHIQEEDFDLLDVEVEDEPSKTKRRRSEGPAFEGTLLGVTPTSSQVTEAPAVFAGNPCPACTFLNQEEDATACTVCDTPLL